MDRHFTITYKGSILSFPGKSTAVIGQTQGCDVRLPNNSQYEDAIFTKILPNKNNDGWHIVKVSHFYLKNRDKIIELLRENPKHTTRTLAEEIGITPKGVERHLAILKSEGILHRISPGKGGEWQVVEVS